MVDSKMKALGVVRKDIESGAVDVPRELLKTVVEKLMGAEADALCGAGYGERSDDRANRRNGYRERPWDTRVGSIPLDIPRLRKGSYFPHWLLEPRRRAERALAEVVAEAYVLGVSTRRVDKLVQSMGIDGISKSEVSRLAEELDELVEEFRSRPLAEGPHTYVWLDAHTQRCREGGRIVNVATVMAIGINADGHREVLGLDVVTTEDGAGWTALLRGLTARGLRGVRLVISDAHEGLKDAIGAVLPGASWQRCRTHFMRNLLTRVRKSSQQMVATLVRSIFAQTSHEAVWEQQRRVYDQLHKSFPEAAEMLDEASPDVLAYSTLPRDQLEADLVDQPDGAAEQGNPAAHGRRGHLPEPGGDHPPGRGRARRAKRRVGRRSSLHEPRAAGQGETERHQRQQRRGGQRLDRRARGGELITSDGGVGLRTPLDGT